MDIEKPPKKDFANHLHEYFNQVAKTLTGGFLNPLVDIILPSFHQKQFELWCEEVYETLLNLENEKITIEDLRNNIEFVSILKETIIIASKNHESEKLALLKSSLLNSINDSISYDEKLIFTRLIDTLSVSHHIVLKVLSENIENFKDLDRYQKIYEVFIEIVNNSSVSKGQFIYLLEDLEKNRLIRVSRDVEDDKIVKEATRFTDGYGDNKLPFMLVTDFGREYLKYIIV